MTAQISREWATPLTIGAFALMAVTGVLMFYHLNNPLQETVHAWVGWVMVGAVLLHAVANWLGFKRYFKAFGRAPVIMAVAAVVMLGTYVMAPSGEGSTPVPAIAIQALAKAPIRQVAPLFGKTPEEARRVLSAVGIVLPDDDTSIGRVAGPDREQMGRALQALSRSAAK